MIIQEPYNESLIKTYSDENKYIILNETNIKYIEAVDLPNKYTYSESDEEIEILDTDFDNVREEINH